GKTDILIGTKMMAKGWDFPNVTLTGIIAADLTLNFPDFRAAELTFQNITQVAGRCGRGDSPGTVILQTYRPDEKVLQFGAAQDYKGFYNWESSNRKLYGYPPYSQNLRVLFTAPRGYFSQSDIDSIRSAFRDSSTEDNAISILGPAPGIYRYSRDEERWVLNLMGEDLDELKGIYKLALEKMMKEKIMDNSVKIQAEINPIHIV
ncbi:MAG: primosomal protein N', partial [Bacillota bacterium]|nr:primosomal protein N' [Bacillota bacterium]